MPNAASLDAINKIYDDYITNHQYLIDNGQVSIAMDYKSQYSKIMLLSAASYFESKVVRIVMDFLNVDKCPLRSSFLEKKALKRQYHTLFNWDQLNANQFFSLFGDDFKIFIRDKVSHDQELKAAIEDFMVLGSFRNQLVHDNYATFRLPLTAEDVKKKFDNADKFVERINLLVVEFKDGLI